MAPVATYIKLEHLNKQKINTLITKIDRIDSLDKSITDFKRQLRYLWFGYYIQIFLNLYLIIYRLIQDYPFK